jgi:DNA-binding response OmpR family regulator
MAAQLSVLVVDDDQNIRKIVTFHLQQEGYKVGQAKNGAEAIELAKAEKYDVALLDVMMPVMDGYAVCKTLKTTPQTKDMVVIMFTAKGRKEDVVEALKVGADDYCLKPFNKSVLVDKLKKIQLAKTLKAPVFDRRQRRAVPKSVTVSWGERTPVGTEVTYKERVIDISEKGLAFEHKRCDVCTGYEKGTVHPLCPFSRVARRFPESGILELMLSLPDNQVLLIKAKVAHVFQPPETPATEKVGVSFVELTRDQQRIIKGLTS